MGNTTLVDLSLMFGILAGPSIGGIGKVQEKQASGRKEPENPVPSSNQRAVRMPVCRAFHAHAAPARCMQPGRG